jgi:hypothetical protein
MGELYQMRAELDYLGSRINLSSKLGTVLSVVPDAPPLLTKGKTFSKTFALAL